MKWCETSIFFPQVLSVRYVAPEFALQPKKIFRQPGKKIIFVCVLPPALKQRHFIATSCSRVTTSHAL